MMDRRVYANAERRQTAEPGPRFPHLLIVCVWLLMLNCLSWPGRTAPLTVGSLDLIAILKLITRVSVLGVLVLNVLRHGDLPHRGPILNGLAPMACFVGWAFLSTLWSPLTSVTLGQAISLAVLFLWGVNVALFCRGEPQAKHLWGGLSCGLLLASGLLLAAHHLAPEFGRLDRLHPGLMHPTSVASTCSLGFLVLLLCGLVWGWRWARLQLGPGLLIHVPLLILAANRTSELLTAVLLGVLLLVFTARAWLWSAVVALSVATAAYVACDPGFEGAQVPLRLLTQQIERDEHSSLEGFSGRDEMWAAVWGSFLQSPWIGHGYFVTSERGELYVWHTWANWTAHNMGLQVLASTGLVGGLLFVAGVATPMVRAWRRRHASPYNRRALWMLGFLIFWFFVWGMANESWLGPVEPESIVFFTTLGFAASLSPLPMAASVQPREAFAIA